MLVKTLLIAAVIFLIMHVLARLTANHKFSQLRRQGIYPRKGMESHADVVRLLQRGEHTLALRCHRAAHGVSLSDARKHIAQIRKSIR